MEHVLQTYGLTKFYKRNCVVDHVSMNIRRGEIYGFVGRNGAGKTTVMRLICGLIQKSSGSYELFGKRDDDARLDAVRRRIGAIIETPSVYPDMTAVQNLREQCFVLGITDPNVVPEVLEYVGLQDTGKKRVRNFSLGMRQRLGIAMSLVGSPDFVILDEPVNGLDPQGIVEIRELLLRLNREKSITILISSHILGELSKLATCYGFIEKGRLLKEITAAELEEACRKSIRIQVNTTDSLACVLEREFSLFGFKIISEHEAEIYDEIPIGKLALALHAAGIELYRVLEKEENLEGYFLNLVGGASQ